MTGFEVVAASFPGRVERQRNPIRGPAKEAAKRPNSCANWIAPLTRPVFALGPGSPSAPLQASGKGRSTGSITWRWYHRCDDDHPRWKPSADLTHRFMIRRKIFTIPFSEIGRRIGQRPEIDRADFHQICETILPGPRA